LVLKLDCEKTFHKVSHYFLLDCLAKRGFGKKWIDLIKSIIFGSSVGVKLNNVIGDLFLTSKGLRQGDTLSCLLFDQVVDSVTRMLAKAPNAILIIGLCSDV
jgi:hypothetical protein